jgi:hypothetical protein
VLGFEPGTSELAARTLTTRPDSDIRKLPLIIFQSTIFLEPSDTFGSQLFLLEYKVRNYTDDVSFV